MPFIPHTPDDVRVMLDAIGVPSLDTLFDEIPPALRVGELSALPEALSEGQVSRLLTERAAEPQPLCFLGAGAYEHFIPAAVWDIAGRGEFYSAYTPYQPEVSQGTLQGLFEFQTMVCELLGMEIANASMYDGASAAAEAVLMAERIKTRNKTGPVLLARSLHPWYRATIATYLAHSSRPLIEIAFEEESGRLDLERLRSGLKGALAVVVQHPNYFGVLEDLMELARLCREAEAVLIVVVTEALSLGLLDPPGAVGADLVAAEGQSLGIPMGFGGPHLGLLAGREEDARKIPGRLVGETVDQEGRRGYVLTLATREQHIRRAKATSNICTAQGMLALAASIYMTLLGPEGLAELAAINRARSEYLKQVLAERGLGHLRFRAPTFNEFVLDLGRDPAKILERLKDRGFLAGIPLGHDFPELRHAVLVTVTEMVEKDDLDGLASALAVEMK
jgi:glycine dehydrogenase subunit 1